MAGVPAAHVNKQAVRFDAQPLNSTVATCLGFVTCVSTRWGAWAHAAGHTPCTGCTRWLPLFPATPAHGGDPHHHALRAAYQTPSNPRR